MQYAVCIMQRCQTEMKYDNNKNQSYEQKCGKGQYESETELLRNISFSLYLVGYLFVFCQNKKMQWTTCPIFFFKFLDGWILFAIFATEKDAAEIKLRERGSLYQSAARLSLEGTASGCSSSRLLPQVFMYMNHCEK